jgi:hypothetical protein
MKSIYFRVPALFCTVISVAALLGSLRNGSRWWQPVFFAFLPGCFLIMGSINAKMNRELRRLRRRVARLEGRRLPIPAAGHASEEDEDED